MGGGREKGLGRTTVLISVQGDPQLTNRLGRFRIWVLTVNPTHCSTSQGSCATQESQLDKLLEHSVCLETLRNQAPNTYSRHENVSAQDIREVELQLLAARA